LYSVINFMSEAVTIGGGWLGTYAYKGAGRTQPPVRFEATIRMPGSEGGFVGSILDDGGLGEADIHGEQSRLGLRFSKVYRNRKAAPVSYEGTLAEDGQTMQGTWQISSIAHGVWDARRTWSDSDDSKAEETKQEQDAPRVREVVRLG
jgi:hypothetical protein